MTEEAKSSVDIRNLAGATTHLSDSALSKILALSSGGRDLLNKDPLLFDRDSHSLHISDDDSILAAV